MRKLAWLQLGLCVYFVVMTVVAVGDTKAMAVGGYGIIVSGIGLYLVINS